MPLLVIPVGYFGYTYDLGECKKEEENIEDYSWEYYYRQQSKHDIQDNVDANYIRSS
jgi:hypothetical protein